MFPGFLPLSRWSLLRAACGTIVGVALLGACALPFSDRTAPSGSPPPDRSPGSSLPRLDHLVIMVMENESLSGALKDPSFSRLAQRGALLRRYYGIAHVSLPNYLAMTSGVAPSAATTDDCPHFDCQVRDPNLAQQLDAAHVSWKGYFGGTDNPCLTPTPGHDRYTRGYLTHHNPFAYYPDVGANPEGGTDGCRRHLRPLPELDSDAQANLLPAFAFVIPDSCEDGHDRPCAGGRPGGVGTASDRAERTRASLEASSAWDRRSLMVLTFDEGDEDDDSGCCGSPGGGLTAAIMISGLIAPGTSSERPYDHYSLLRTVEDALGLRGHLGRAAERDPIADVFTPS